MTTLGVQAAEGETTAIAEAAIEEAAVTAAQAVRPTEDAAPVTGERVRRPDALYFEVCEWLDDEATLLDQNRIMEWVGSYIAEDLLYRVPVRQNRLRDDPRSQFSDGMYHYDENATTLYMKVMRLATTASPWAENPQSRTRRLVTNVKVYRTPVADEFTVVSSLLITRSRYTEDRLLVLAGERRDLLRRADGGFKLARRHVYFDQTTMGWPNLAIFF